MAPPLCHLRRAHVLKYITAARAEYGLCLADSVNALPFEISVGLPDGSPRVMRASVARSCALSSVPAHREVEHLAAAAGVESVMLAPCGSPKASGLSVTKSAYQWKDVGAQGSEWGRGRIMVRMMTAVDIML